MTGNDDDDDDDDDDDASMKVQNQYPNIHYNIARKFA